MNFIELDGVQTKMLINVACIEAIFGELYEPARIATIGNANVYMVKQTVHEVLALIPPALNGEMKQRD